MAKLNSYSVVLVSSLAWSAILIIGSEFIESEALFTSLSAALALVAALMLPISLKNRLPESRRAAGLTNTPAAAGRPNKRHPARVSEIARQRAPDKGKNFADEELSRDGALSGILMGALGLGGLLTALQYIPVLWVLGLSLCAPLLSAVIGRREASGVKAAALLIGYMGFVTMTNGLDLSTVHIKGLAAGCLGAVALALGLSHHRLTGRRPSTTLAFWGALTAAVFLIPAALAEPVKLMDLSLAQWLTAAILGLTILIGTGGWLWLTESGRGESVNHLSRAAAPVLSLLTLIMALELDVRAGESAGLALLALGVWLSGRNETRRYASAAPQPLVQEAPRASANRKAA